MFCSFRMVENIQNNTIEECLCLYQLPLLSYITRDCLFLGVQNVQFFSSGQFIFNS